MPSQQIEQIRAKAKNGQPNAQFLLSQICHQSSDFENMIYWLQQASAHDHADALDALGHCHERGLSIAQDFVAAMAHYDRAIDAGAIQASYRKADLLYRSKNGQNDEAVIRGLLVAAAKSDSVAALGSIGYLAMQRQSDIGLAIRCLRQAAEAGDAVASFNLGWCLSQASDTENANTEAAFWLRRAAAMNYPFAESILASLGNARSDTKFAPTVGDEHISTSFSLFPEMRNVNRQILSSSPPITVFNAVLDVADCAYLIFAARQHLQRADVIDPTSERGEMVSDVRTNLSTFLPFGLVDIISRYVELKIVHETGENLARSEPMSILCYSRGEYYKPHVDYFNPNLTVSKGLMENGGQRTASAITYLCEPSLGGGTSFPRLGLTSQATLGNSLWFRNCRDDGQIDDRTLHAGDTVVRGEKWVMTKWFRERPTQYLEN